MMRRFLSALAIAALLARPCEAAITIVTLGSHVQAASTTNVLTTAVNDCPVGSTVIVLAAYTTIADTLSSVADSGVNTWQTPFDNITGTGIGIGWAVAYKTTVDIPIGGTITATFAGSVTTEIGAACIQSLATSAALDTSNHSSNGAAATTATTVNSGTLAQPNELVIGGLVTATTTGVTQTCNGSYTKIVGGGTGTPDMFLCSLVVSSTASNSFTPTWGTAGNYVSDIISFKGSVTGLHTPLTLTGAGP